MPEIEKYQVLSAHDHVTLEEQIEKAISRGWQPLGGVSVAFIPSTISVDKDSIRREVESNKTLYCQAMIKFKAVRIG